MCRIDITFAQNLFFCATEHYMSFNKNIEKSIVSNWNYDALTDYKGATLQFNDVARKIEKVHILLEQAGIKKGDKVRKVKKCKKKKRFGRSILHRCPGAFQADLKKKFGTGYHEVHRKFRASQYDHVLNDYIKKKLSARWHVLPDGKRIQRDIYSAFLMYCSDETYTRSERNRCLKEFDTFYEKHEKLIESIINQHLNICNSGISA